MRIGLLATIAAALIFVTGCGKDEATQPSTDVAATTGGSGATPNTTPASNKLVGTWTETGDEGSAGIAVFKEDGTFTLTSTLAENEGITIRATGTYSLDSETGMTRTFEEFDVQGATEEQRQTMQKGFDELKGKPRKGTIEWVSDTEIKFTDEDGAPSTWKKT